MTRTLCIYVMIYVMNVMIMDEEENKNDRWWKKVDKTNR